MLHDIASGFDIAQNPADVARQQRFVMFERRQNPIPMEGIWATVPLAVVLEVLVFFGRHMLRLFLRSLTVERISRGFVTEKRTPSEKIAGAISAARNHCRM